MLFHLEQTQNNLQYMKRRALLKKIHYLQTWVITLQKPNIIYLATSVKVWNRTGAVVHDRSREECYCSRWALIKYRILTQFHMDMILRPIILRCMHIWHARMQSRWNHTNLLVRTSTTNYIAARDLCKLPNNLTNSAGCRRDKDIITFLRLAYFKESSICSKPRQSWISRDSIQ